MDNSAEQDAGLTWEAYLPGLFDQPTSAAPGPLPGAAPLAGSAPLAESSPLAELVEARPATRRQAQGTATSPPNRPGGSPTPTPASFPPPAASTRFVVRPPVRTPLTPRGTIVMGIAIFLGFVLFLMLLP